VEAMDEFPSKRELLDKLEDSHSFGAACVHDILLFIEDSDTLEDLLIYLLRNILNDEMSQPLTKCLGNHVLVNIYTVPGLLMGLVDMDGVSMLRILSANTFCQFLIELSLAFVKPRMSKSMAALACSLRDQGNVHCVDRLCRILLVDEGPNHKDLISESDSHRRIRVTAWGNNLNPPGGCHDNDDLNYQNIRLLPTLDEICCNTPSYLPLASGDNTFIKDANQRLLDSNFCLLHEDTVQTMKNSINKP
jgi:hypothetical protein